MPEPVTITLAALGMSALTEGIKFLYGQAAELIKWHREKKKTAAAGVDAAHTPEPNLLTRPSVFESPSQPANIDEAALLRLEAPIRTLSNNLAAISSGMDTLAVDDVATLKQVDTLRQALEMILGQRLTFSGEQRPEATGPVVRSKVEIDKLYGAATGMEIGHMAAGTAEAQLNVKEVLPGATATGLKADKVG